MEVTVRNPILDEYKASKELHEEFCKKVNGLITDILKQNDLRYHSIESRVKQESSLELKVNKSDGKYSNLSDITDVSGLRIITYFSEDVDKIASIIQSEFEVDEENSVDKRIKLDPDRFGYLSLHYVVKLNSTRVGLSEYIRFKDLKVEIQIRSILQHAWAEIEHDLGYKNKLSIPNVVRRDFSRLAGLLEIADEEFVKIRKTLEEYNISIKEVIKATPANVLIDKVTLRQLLDEKDSIIKHVDLEISKISQFPLHSSDEDGIESNVKRLKFLGLNSIEEVINSLHEYQEKIILFANEWLKPREKDLYFEAGISLFYLAYVMLSTSPEKLNEYINIFGIGDKDDRETLSERIIQLCE
ncbi:GTP pyrophosphokinase [Peribacillus sp. TH14]|uniref:GTP pyrophosphokinase n=1 Tax=Peribacillus sp. TH14 TaxID=2798481 RepID=UPI0019132900|nr:(p)ppGpp synthetase [Peribacillus sp. TH14]MBK5497397.1 (p)ppGpp synthetase [Peribacillus sp. TH14]